MRYKHVRTEHLLKYPNIFVRWLLFMRGKRDAKRNFLEKRNNFWWSAYMCREISTAKADIENERNAFYTDNTNLMFKMERIDLIKKQIESHPKTSSIKMPVAFPCKSSYVEVTDSFTQIIMDDCLFNVLSAREFTKQKKQDYYEDILLGLDNKRLEHKFSLMRRYTAAHARATQIYDILIARLSIYWAGVVSVGKKSGSMNGSVKSLEDSVFGLGDIESIIDNYFVDMEDAKYGKKYLQTA